MLFAVGNTKVNVVSPELERKGEVSIIHGAASVCPSALALFMTSQSKPCKLAVVIPILQLKSLLLRQAMSSHLSITWVCIRNAESQAPPAVLNQKLHFTTLPGDRVYIQV